MKNKKSSYHMIEALAKKASRILFIIRTRKMYGYNSVAERIFRDIFNTKKRSSTYKRDQMGHNNTFIRG